MNNEAAVRANVDLHITGQGGFFQPIESPSTANGIPDAFLRVGKRDAWMEIKNERYAPPTPYWVSFRPGQYQWLTEYTLRGGLSLLLIAVPTGFAFFHGANIKRKYDKPLNECANLWLHHIDGEALCNWITTL